MKTLLAPVLFCVAIFAFTTPLLAADGPNVASPSPLSSSNNADVRRMETPDGKRIVEVILGETAQAHLQNAKLRRSRAFEKAARVLQQKGYRRTNEVVVVRTLDKQAWLRSRDGIHPAYDYASSEDGEIIFWSWDDGDDSTWEGNVYIEKYSTGGYVSLDGQVDPGYTEIPPVWEETIEYYGGGGGGPDEDQPLMTSLGRGKPIQLASLMSDIGFAVNRNLDDSHIQLVQWREYLREWGKCFGPNCAVAVGTCRWAGPAWAKCSLAGCGIAAVACGIAAAF